MASLQKKRGKGKDKDKWFYQTQPYVNGKRLTIRFGSGKKKAETALKAISDLLDSKNAGLEEFAPTTRVWLESKADLPICKTLR